MVVQHLSLVLHEGGLNLQDSLHDLLQFTEFFSFGEFWKEEVDS